LAGGGGGSTYNGPIPGTGGLGGGGNGCQTSGSDVGGTNGTVNTGGGGGGGRFQNGANTTSFAGGSGVCYVSYSSPSQRATGGNEINSGSGIVTHIFKSSGTFTS
jgi:hypothetical protein